MHLAVLQKVPRGPQRPADPKFGNQWYRYMFICTELIEETGRLPWLIFGICEYFWPGSDHFEFWEFFLTFYGFMTCCHIFESVKNHINADISHPIRDRNAKNLIRY